MKTAPSLDVVMVMSMSAVVRLVMTVTLDTNDQCTNLCQIAICGDGIIQSTWRAAMRGNLINGDADVDVRIAKKKFGWEWSLQEGETDDGNLINSDGCDSNCRIERCADGVRQAGEQCDDGNEDNTDTCISHYL